MEIPNFRLAADEYEKIVFILKHLQDKLHSESIFLINRNGQKIADHGNARDIDTQALSSLAASNLAATFGLASLIGENEFERIYHQGEVNSILINPVGHYAMLLMVFDVRNGQRIDFTSLKQAALILEDVLSKCTSA